MRDLLPILLFAAACSGEPKITPDLSVQDLLDEPDLSSPPDLTPVTCTLPGPGFYAETTRYNLLAVSTGQSQFVVNGPMNAIVDATNRIERPPLSIFTPSVWRCDNIQPSPHTCLAPCCEAVVPTVPPILRYTNGDATAGTRAGWRMISTGRCKFTDSFGALWYADLSDVRGEPQ